MQGVFGKRVGERALEEKISFHQIAIHFEPFNLKMCMLEKIFQLAFMFISASFCVFFPGHPEIHRILVRCFEQQILVKMNCPLIFL
jgi:hypothetical protein